MNGRNRQPSPAHARPESKTRPDGLNAQAFLSGAAVGAALGGQGGSPGPVVNGRPLYPISSGPACIPYMPSIFNSPKAGTPARLNSEPLVGGSTGGSPATTPTAMQVQQPRSGAQTPTRASPGQMTSPKAPGFTQPTFSSGLPYSPAARRNSNSMSATAPAASLAGLGMARLVDASAASTSQRNGPPITQLSHLSASLPTNTARPGSSGSVTLATTTTSARPGAPASPAATATGPAPRQAQGVPGLTLSVGSNQSLGCRGYQEDFRHVLEPTPQLAGLSSILLAAAVYDGHGGKQISQWLTTSYCLLNRCAEAVQAVVSGGGTPNDLAPALDEVFVTCGAAALASRMTSGSCVAIAMMLHAGGLPWVVSANVGDSRTVLVSWDDDGSRLEGAALSVDHKLGPAKTSEETRRVQAAGGAVIQLFGTWRIDGSLAVARAIGDADFSRYVSCHPSVSCRQLSRRDRWLVIASDGLYDVMTNEEVAQFCRAQHQLTAAKMSEALVREAVRNRGSGDNTTAVAVRIQYA